MYRCTINGRLVNVCLQICLKQWNLQYATFAWPPPFDIISGNLYFPPDHFVYNTSPYSTRNCSFIRPFTRLNDIYHLFVPSVISLWNNLPQRWRRNHRGTSPRKFSMVENKGVPSYGHTPKQLPRPSRVIAYMM